DNGDAYLLAERQFRAALAADDGSIDALNGLGWALRARGLSSGNRGLYAEAEQALQRSLQANPRHPDALFGMGWVAFAREQYGDAASYFEQAVAQSPLDHTPRFWLGLTLERMGRATEERSVLREAQQLGSPFANEALARLGP
ncbi:MAG TPA: tetratricopeptide repeat protein, partial [Roseiflexaceae bacterium]|nr:tetratricopeptide repeat protein [Roseiflexaceae bacterium]